MKQNYHRLLKRQLKKNGLDTESNPQFLAFIDQVSQAYNDFNTEYTDLENILEKSCQELYISNKNLQYNVSSITSKQENIANNIRDVIFEADYEGKWLYLNPAWEELTGVSVEDSLQKSFMHFIKDIKGEHLSTLNDLYHNKTNKFQETLEIITPDNKTKWLDVSLKQIRDQNGQGTRYIGTLVDVTPQKEFELSLIRAKNKEIKANKAKGEFLSTISHEIRTPLNAVIGISHLLLLEDPTEEQIENLRALTYSSEHLLGLVNDILDFDKIESGNIILEKSVFSIENILKAVETTFSRIAEEKGVKFLIKKQTALPDLLLGDSIRISQILTNLVSNAIKFTEKGSVVLKIKADNTNQHDTTLKFEIKDTGIGIAKAKQKNIFKAFVQANSNTTRKFGGTGLGLAICKKLLRIMGSDLKLKSKLGVGSIFSFSLVLDVHNKTSLDTFKKDNNISKLETLDGISVLVAEDHKLNILVLKKFLSKWNVNFDIAENGLIAVEKANSKNYDLILMDIQMPIMNGYEAAQKIRASKNSHNVDVPIIALSASASVDVKTDIGNYGIDSHICKPFCPKELHQTLLNTTSISETFN